MTSVRCPICDVQYNTHQQNLNCPHKDRYPSEGDKITLTGHDPVAHPTHYTSHPSGVECIVVTEHMSFCRGNAVKYLWRAGEKGDEIEDLKKAVWYIEREILRLKAKQDRG